MSVDCHPSPLLVVKKPCVDVLTALLGGNEGLEQWAAAVGQGERDRRRLSRKEWVSCACWTWHAMNEA
eukprot:scaffold57415_cov22-Tisochrysis_lutea.AAC.1